MPLPLEEKKFFRNELFFPLSGPCTNETCHTCSKKKHTGWLGDWSRLRIFKFGVTRYFFTDEHPKACC